MRNLTVLLSDKLQKCWLCRHTFMANSRLVATGDRVAYPGFICLNERVNGLFIWNTKISVTLI
jgi:hypothetical protein